MAAEGGDVGSNSAGGGVGPPPPPPPLASLSTQLDEKHGDGSIAMDGAEGGGRGLRPCIPSEADREAAIKMLPPPDLTEAHTCDACGKDILGVGLCLLLVDEV